MMQRVDGIPSGCFLDVKSESPALGFFWRSQVLGEVSSMLFVP